MINLNLFAGQISEPIEVGAGARITTLGSGKVQYLAGTLSDARNNNGTWTDWPRGSTAGSDDVLRRMVIRGVATGVMTITIDEEKQDEAPDGAYFDSQLATFTTDANGNTVLAGADGRGFAARKLRHNVLSRCPLGGLQVSVGNGGLSTHITAELAGRPIAIRIGIPNLTTGTPTIDGSFGFDTTLGAVNSTQDKGGSVAAWTPLTFDDGAASGTHTARVDATTPTYVFSDWIGCDALERADGGDGAILHLNLVQGAAAGDATWFNGIWAASTTTEAVATHVWRGYRSNTAADYATTNQSLFPANSTSAVAGHLACIIQYVTLTEGVTLLSTGDSLASGTAAAGVMVANGYGWGAKARDLLSTPGIPVEFCNLGWSGSSAAQALARFEIQAPYLKNALLMPMVFSTNDAAQPINAANIATMKSALGRALAIAHQYDMTTMLRTSTPCNATVEAGGLGGASAKNYAEGDPLRVAFDAEVMAGSELKFNVASVLSGAAVASGTSIGQIEYSAEKTTDGVHPNDSGYTDWAVALAQTLAPML